MQYQPVPIHADPPSHYDVLGVNKDATTAEIRRAYRNLALRWHPDKNPTNREESERRFVQIGAAYEILSNEQSRAAYDRGGTDLVQGGRRSGNPFDFHRAASMFNENFGEALANEWQPGMRVVGRLVRDGKRVSITIHPDGTTEEQEVDGARGTYSYVSKSSGGSSQTHIQFNGSLGHALADAVLPPSVQEIPRLGPALRTAISWAPSVACAGCCYFCCCH